MPIARIAAYLGCLCDVRVTVATTAYQVLVIDPIRHQHRSSGLGCSETR
jgi:hypothetical protein